MRQRRFLPSTRSLLAFDAVMRLGSVTAAAHELDLTQSAVSRLVLGLEQQLGKDLFVRAQRRLTPTAAAIRYAQDVRRALDIVQRASMAVVANPEGGTLSLAVLPTFGTRWLGPRLGAFLSAHPGISVNMSARIESVDMAVEGFDAVIYYGESERPGLNGMKLFDERVTACVSSDFAKQHRPESLHHLADLPLLYLESRPQVWGDWFAGQGEVMPEGTGGMMMDQFSMMIQAAISGLGVALLPDYMAQIEISEGRLHPLFQQAVPVRSAYWLGWSKVASETAPITAFRSWLEGQCSAINGS